jgi:hypothetical protein
MQMVVQGEANTIWKATFNSSGVFQSDWQQIPGAIIDTPALAWIPAPTNKMLMVVRGGGNGIWAGTFNSSGVFEGNWAQISGAIYDPPALSLITLPTVPTITNKVLMVVRGAGNTIWAATFNSNGVFENNWTQIPGTILSAPALTWNPNTGRVWMLVQGVGNTIWKASFSTSGSTIFFDGNWQQISGTMLDSPALTWSPSYPGGGRMLMVVRGGGNTIWKATLDSNGNFMNDWQQMTGSIFDPPALALNQSNNNMLMVVRGGEPFTGYWTGTWRSYYGGSSVLYVTMSQNESTISGYITVYSYEIGWVYNYPVSGTVSGNNFYITFDFPYGFFVYDNVYSGTLNNINNITGYYSISGFDYYDAGTFTLSR